MRQIPTYSLYGDVIGEPMRDWLHSETIQSRSRLHGYLIEPHRHAELFQILWLTGGRADVRLDGTRTELLPPALVIVPAAVVHGYRFSADVAGIVVTLLERDLRAVGFDDTKPGLLGPGADGVTAALAGLLREADHRGSGHDRAMQAHLTLLAVALRRALRGSADGAGAAEPARGHAQAFLRLVDEHYRRTRRLADYADALGISSTHLNRVCREVLGLSALAAIEQRIALEARRMLLFSTLPIKRIGAELGYEDPAYFTRFFTRMLGRSPAAFRAEHRSA